MPLLPAHDPFWWLTALRCYLLIHLLALAMWPWVTRFFSSRADRGTGLAIPGGLLIFLQIAQAAWRIGFLEPHPVWLLLLMVLLGLAGWGWLYQQPASSFGTRARMRGHLIQSWLLFTVLFWFCAGIRAADPGVSHTEQPMDLMWMRSSLASTPPHIGDAWLGGAAASYYADGQQLLAFLGRLLGLPIQVSVNLTQIIWFALSGLLAFQAGKSLYHLQNKRGGNLAGLLSLLFMLFVSTPRGFADALKSASGWWWWEASRPITDNGSLLITEFPFFSFWLGDNHAHLIGLPLLLFALLCGIELLRCRQIRLWQGLLPFVLVAWSWRVNPWQTPTMLAIPLLALLLRKRKWQKQDLIWLGGSALIALWFCLPARSPGPPLRISWNTHGHSNPWEVMLVFGFLLPGLAWFWIKAPPRFWLGLYLLMLAMFTCAEVVYLDDAFHNRMNTVFKVYFQLWILAALLGALAWTRVWQEMKGLRTFSLLCLCGCLVPGLVYAGKLCWQASRVPHKSLNAWSMMSADDQFFLEVASRLIQPGERIAEAPGKSYDPSTSQLGTWTAGSTLIGWTGHQQQWRPGQAQPQLWMLYEAGSPDDLQAALEDLQLDWVLLGPHERDAFQIHPDWQSWMDTRASRVVDQPERCLYRIR